VDAGPATAAPAAPAPDAAAATAPPAPETAPPPAPAVAAAPTQTAPALPVAPPPRFTPVADATAGGPAPQRLAPPAAGDAPAALDTAAPAPAPVAEAAPEPAPEAPAPRLPQVTAPPAAAMPAPAPAPAPALPQVAGAGSSPRLPQAGTAAAPPAAEPEPEPAPVPAGPPVALRDNAVAFTATPDQPLLAVVLIDEPGNALDPAVLAGIPFPVSFALDPLRPDAAARAAELRAAGFEVVILGAAAIPAGAAPGDVEVALAAARAALPQAVALMDDPAGRIQGDRPVLDATVAALAETGHGLIAFPRGLNAAEETARRTGLPAATVFRLLDDEDQSAPVIARFLGRAGFAAGQEGAAVVVGRTRPDTVTALFSWALGGRTEGVALAPVSAVLLRLSE
jgi:polysaccharide deacetylase 2 family uncharacterized protein YibQ